MNSETASPEQPQHFSPGDPAAREHLLDQGYAVFKAVVPPKQCSISLGHFWNWIRATSDQKVVPGDVDTYHHWPTTVSKGGILAYQGIGQSEFCWGIRTQSEVIGAFATLWQTEDLLTSFDGACVMRPWTHDLSWKTQRTWFHVDQNPAVYPKFDCIQGLVNLLPMTQASGANLLVPGSHNHFTTYSTRYPDIVANLPQDEHYFEIPAEDPVLNQRNFKPLRIDLEVGDLLCWDSRTAHCNCPGTDGQAIDPVDNLLRATVFVCMVPRRMASAAVIDARKQAVGSQTTTTHRPHIFSPTDAYADWQARVKRGERLIYPDKPASMTTQRLRLVGYSTQDTGIPSCNFYS